MPRANGPAGILRRMVRGGVDLDDLAGIAEGDVDALAGRIADDAVWLVEDFGFPDGLSVSPSRNTTVSSK